MSVSTDGPINLATPASSALEHIAPAAPPVTESDVAGPSAAVHASETPETAVHQGNVDGKGSHAATEPVITGSQSTTNSASATAAAAALGSAPNVPSSPVTRSRASINANVEAGPSRTSPRSTAGRPRIPTQTKAEAPLPPPRQPFLQPHHFSSLDNGARPPTALRSEWRPVYPDEEGMLSPEDDPMALRGIPVFHPTMEEFKDFEGYVTRTAPWGMRSGIVKVVPPAEWSETLPPMDRRMLSQVQIKRPIQQNMMGSAGIYRAHNIEKNKSRALSVREWFDKCQDDAFAPPSIKTYERDSKELKAAHAAARQEKAEREKRKKEEARAKREKSKSERMKREEDRQRLASQVTEGADGTKHEVPELDPASSGSSRSSEPAKTPELEPLDPWYESVDLKTAWLPKNVSEEDYTDEACTKLQEKYWKTMGLGEPSWYGADLMQGSLFADKDTPWNVAHLPNLLDRVKCVVPGVNEPYLYFGMWRATFAWHVEDMDLFSINYIHFGAPKYWYAIPQGQAEQLERFLANEFPIDSKSCDQFIRHKSMAISPSRLRSAGIRCNMLVHRQNEFVITYPKGYHAGFNMGFNCAESVNFALDSWIDYGRKAKHCRCVRDSVRIDVDKMLKDAEDAVAQPAGVKVAKRAKFMAHDAQAQGAEQEQGQEQGITEKKRAPRKEKQQREAGEEEDTPRKRRRTKKDRVDVAGEDGEAVQLEPIPAYAPIPEKRIIDIAQPEHFVPLDLEHPPHSALSNVSQPAANAAYPPQPPQPLTIHPPPISGLPQSSAHPPAQPANPFTLEPAPSAKKGRPRKSLVTAPAAIYPCLFCPSLNEADRAFVQEPNDFVKAQWRGGKEKPVMAHIRCAQATPEVAIVDVDKEGGGVEAWITGVNDIVKARWKLKCKACDAHNESTGVKVQCTKGKCVQAYHYTCAEQDEKVTCNLWQVEQTFKQDEDVEDSPMVTDISLKLELLCPAHNPEQKAIREQEKLDDLKRQLLAMIPGQSIKLKMGPAATSCRLVKVLEQEHMVEVDIDGVSQILPWSKVDIKPTPAPKVVENEYARHHTHKRDGAPPTPVTASSTASLPAKTPKGAKEPKTKAPKTKSAKQDPLAPREEAPQASKPRSSLPNIGRTPLPPISTAEVFHPAASVQSGSMQTPRSHSASAAGVALPPLMRSVPMHHRGTSDMAPPPPLGRPPLSMPPPPSNVPYTPYSHPNYAGATESYGYPPYSAPHMGAPPVPHTAMPPPRSAALPHAGQHEHYAPLSHAPSLPGLYAPPPTSTRQVLHPSYPSQPDHNRVYVVDSHAQSHAPAYGYYDHQHPQHHYNLPPLQRSQYPVHQSGYQYGHPSHSSQGYHQSHLPPPALPPPPVQHPAYVYAQPAEHGFTSMQPVHQAPDNRRHSGGPSSYPPPSPVTPQGPPPGSAPYAAATTASMPSPAHFVPVPQTPGIDLGLERMRKIMFKLEPLRTPAIHLAGTNGKGSVSAMLESALMAAGLKVGRYNSPHLLEPRDAVRIDGQPVAADTYTQAIQHIQRIGAGIELTNFEMATAAALDLLNRSRVDVMIIECGMGGARDATNVLPPDLVLATGLTAVGLDHTAFLGNTVEEITGDKAQIAVPGGIMVVGVQPFRAVYDVTAQVCQNRRAKLIYTLSARVTMPASSVSFKPFAPPTLPVVVVQVEDEVGRFQDLPIRLPLLGSHQVDNLALAVTMLDALRKDDRACAVLEKLRWLTDDVIQKGIEQTRWEGRCSWLSHPHFGPMLLDGAHNADSATTLRRYIDSLRLSSKVPLTFVLGLSDSKGKSPDSVLAPLLHNGDGVAVVGFSPVEGMPWVSPVAKEVVERAAMGLKAVHLYQPTGQPSTYAQQGKLEGYGTSQAQMDELASALEWADKRKGLTVVCGSLYLVADAYRLLGA